MAKAGQGEIVKHSDIPSYRLSQSVYAHWSLFLVKEPPEQKQLALTFRELSDLLERDLPPTALHNRT